MSSSRSFLLSNISTEKFQLDFLPCLPVHDMRNSFFSSAKLVLFVWWTLSKISQSTLKLQGKQFTPSQTEDSRNFANHCCGDEVRFSTGVSPSSAFLNEDFWISASFLWKISAVSDLPHYFQSLCLVAILSLLSIFVTWVAWAFK